MGKVEVEVTLQNIKKVIYDKEMTAMQKYVTVKDVVDKVVSKLWGDKEWDLLEEFQAHMENLLMECVAELEKSVEAKEINIWRTLFIKYDYVNKYNISVIEQESNAVLIKGRIKSIDNIKILKKLKYYEKRSNL